MEKQYISPNDIDKITFLDFETTGFKDPAAVSLGIIRVENNKVVYARYFLINPEKEIDYGAYLVHGISNNQVQDKMNFKQIWPEIKQYISGQVICGHNVRFDSSVIKGQVERYHLPCEDYKTICTCDNAKRYITKSDVTDYKLDSICSFFDIQLNNHHDARDDTDACRLIYNKLKHFGNLEYKVIKINQ